MSPIRRRDAVPADRAARRLSAARAVPIAAFAAVLALAFPCVAGEPGPGKGEESVEALIDRLIEIKSYPRPWPDDVIAMLRKARDGAPVDPPLTAYEKLVARGARALPALIAHLSDSRPTKMEPMPGHYDITNAYDRNPRTLPTQPPGTVADHIPSGTSASSHTPMVGDICFDVVGCVVNRDFRAVRGVSGTLFGVPGPWRWLNSPPLSSALREAVEGEWGALDEAGHREALIRDMVTPDTWDRREGAYRLLSLYHPKHAEEQALRILRTPTYDEYAASHFVRDELLKAPTPESRRKLVDDFVLKRGGAAHAGVRAYLFRGLKSEKTRDDARRALVEVYGYGKAGAPMGHPPPKATPLMALGGFIRALGHDRSERIDDAILAVFRGIKGTSLCADVLALACMKRLLGKGHDDEIRTYCERRAGVARPSLAKRLREVLAKLDGKRPASQDAPAPKE